MANPLAALARFEAEWIGCLQTGCHAPGYNCSDRSPDVLLFFRSMAGNPSHPQCGWPLTRDRTNTGPAAARVRERLGGRSRKMTIETMNMAMAVATLYAGVNGDGSAYESGQRLLEGSIGN